MRSIADAPRHGGEQAMPGWHGRCTGIHQHETAGAIGIFGHAGLVAGLAEQSGLLVTGDTGNRNAGW